MKITIIAAGTFKRKSEKEIFQYYGEKLSLPFNLLEIDDKLSGDRLQQEMEKKTPKDSMKIILDGRGKDLTTENFYDLMMSFEHQSVKNVCFYIGPSDGFTKEFIQNGDVILRMGQMTWPHVLVRIMLIEQIYRIQQIKKGHPYHRG